jgi:hypothetical protein
MPSLFAKLTQPWYPSSAIGLDAGVASVVHLERGRGNTCSIRNAATYVLSNNLIRPSFDETNLQDPAQLAAVLTDLASSAGLLRQKRWSLTVPEASTRSILVTIETPSSGSELQDVIKWKIERGFGCELADLSVSKERLPRDSHGRDRYAVIGIKKAILGEYERLFDSLGWRIGLIVPRHMGEAQWLVRNGSHGDALLLSASSQGFTAVVFREKHPLIMRAVDCTPHECEDELYRLLLFYRDRRSEDGQDPAGQLQRFMVVGEGLPRQRAREIVREAMGADLKPLEPSDLGLELPGRDLSFDAIAAPAGLATLSL